MSAVLLAHQGGWDETLLVLAPVALVAGLLHLANRRAKQHLAERGPAAAADGAADAERHTGDEGSQGQRSEGQRSEGDGSEGDGSEGDGSEGDGSEGDEGARR